ncbi:MAG: hypothetical protein LQ350_004342 [Teloschistes chrysophthalmus]|nr:MAG: hypothetical protein LQ350_004342 [Niorma chrysophthalma]
MRGYSILYGRQHRSCMYRTRHAICEDGMTRDLDPVANALSKVSNKTLQTHPLPNPYSLPSSDLIIDFEEPRYYLLRRDVEDFFRATSQQVRRYIHRHPDRPIPLDHPPLTYIWRSVKFLFYPADPTAHHRAGSFSFQDLLDVLDAFALKSSEEGYMSRTGIILTQTGLQVVGRASLLPALAQQHHSQQEGTAAQQEQLQQQQEPPGRKDTAKLSPASPPPLQPTIPPPQPPPTPKPLSPPPHQ